MIDRSIRINEPRVDLGGVFPDSSIITLPPGTERHRAIKLLVQAIVDAGRLPQRSAETILSALIERERFGSSGLWRGFALPHIRTRLVTEMLGAVGMAPEGIEFGTMDGTPSRFIFLVLSPFDSRIAHLELLSRLAAMIQDPSLAAVLLSATTVGDIRRLWRT